MAKPEEFEEKKAEAVHEVNGKPTKVGDAVRYNASDGRIHDAVIKRLDGHHADLEIPDGRQFHAAPHRSASLSVPHTWEHNE